MPIGSSVGTAPQATQPPCSRKAPTAPAERSREASTGADTVVTVSASGDLDALAVALRDGLDGAQRVARVDDTVMLSVRGVQGAIPSVLGAATRAGFDVTDISVSEPSLETVFIDLTGKDLRE